MTTASMLQHDLTERGFRFRCAFVTLTYRPGAFYSPRHISDLLKCYRSWADRRRIKLRYVWVLELQARGAPHYHVLIWLPRGYTPPLPDKQGWWKHGHTNATWARNPVRYIAKYASKGCPAGIYDLPKGARLWGSGGLTCLQVGLRAWRLAPSWLRQKWAAFPPERGVKRVDGYWVDIATGIGLRSPWICDGWLSYGVRLRWRGWTFEDVLL